MSCLMAFLFILAYIYNKDVEVPGGKSENV
jgi:hypothetical protein